jgi:ribosomal protein L11 methyltransferase
MNWQQFTMQLGSMSPELVEEIFERHGASSVTFSDAGDDPVLEPAPGATPMWADTQITGLFDARSDLTMLHADLLKSLSLEALPGLHIEALAEREW